MSQTAGSEGQNSVYFKHGVRRQIIWLAIEYLIQIVDKNFRAPFLSWSQVYIIRPMSDTDADIQWESINISRDVLCISDLHENSCVCMCVCVF